MRTARATRRPWLPTAAVVVLALATACGGAAASPSPATSPSGQTPATPATASTAPAEVARPEPASPVTGRVGGLGGLVDRAFFIGEEKGYFAEQGIQLDVTTFRAMTDMLPLLATDKLDVITGGNNPAFFNAHASGAGGLIVADVTIFRPPGPGVKNGSMVIVRNDLLDQVKRISDLKGRPFAINSAGSIAEEFFEKVLASDGLTPADVTVQVIPYPDQVAALSNRAIDAAMQIEPFITQAHDQNVASPLFDLGTILAGYPNQVLVYSLDFIREKPDLARRFMVAHLKALRYIEDAFVKGIHRDDVVGLYIKHTPIKDPQLYDRMAPLYGETNARINLQAIAQDQQFFVRQGQQRQEIPPQSMVNTSFGEYAVQVLGPYQ